MQTDAQAFIKPCWRTHFWSLPRRYDRSSNISNLPLIFFICRHRCCPSGEFLEVKLYIHLGVFSPGPFYKSPNPLPFIFWLYFAALASLNPSKLEEISPCTCNTTRTRWLICRYGEENLKCTTHWQGLLSMDHTFALNSISKSNAENVDEEIYDLFNIYASNIHAHDRNVDIKSWLGAFLREVGVFGNFKCISFFFFFCW